MTDSRGRQGGCSDVRIVGVSDDTTCLNNLSPVSTSHPPGPTQTVEPPAPPSTSSSRSSSPFSAAGIAGAIIGSVLFLTVAVTLALFVLKRFIGKKPKKRRIVSQVDEDLGPRSHNRPYASPPGTQTPTTHPFDSNPYFGNSALVPPQPYANDKYQTSNSSLNGYYDPTTSYVPSPALYPPQPNYRHSTQSSLADTISTGTALPSPPTQSFNVTHTQPSVHLSPPSTSDSGTVTAAQRKAAMAGKSQPSRFIVHTDAEDGLTPNEDGVVELPPQYSEWRAPIRLDPPPPPDSIHSHS